MDELTRLALAGTQRRFVGVRALVRRRQREVWRLGTDVLLVIARRACAELVTAVRAAEATG